MTVRNIFNEALIKFYKKLNKKVLTSLEEIEANTDESNFAGATAVSELYNNLTRSLGGNSLTYNESEDAYYIQYGADSVPKKLGNSGYYFKKLYMEAIQYVDQNRYYGGYGTSSITLDVADYSTLSIKSTSCFGENNTYHRDSTVLSNGKIIATISTSSTAVQMVDIKDYDEITISLSRGFYGYDEINNHATVTLNDVYIY